MVGSTNRVSHHTESTKKGVNLKGLRKIKALIEEQVKRGRFKDDVFIVESKGKFEERERDFTFDGQNSYEEFRFRRLRIEGVTDFRKLTINHLVEIWVKDTRNVTPGKRRLADNNKILNDGSNPKEPLSEIGRPTYFISCPWQSTVAKFFETLEGFLALSQSTTNASDEIFVWSDWISMNLHPDTTQYKDDIQGLVQGDTIKTCKSGCVAICDMQKISPFTNAWILHEWDHALFYHGLAGLQFLGLESSETEALSEVDGAALEEKVYCFNKKDREDVLTDIKKHHGSFADFFEKVKAKLS